MTICIAAICHAPPQPERAEAPRVPYIIGATDKKITAGDIQFEPPIGKWWILGHGIVALLAGASDAQVEILQDVGSDHKTVRGAVSAYCYRLGRYNKVRAEQKVLSQFGLTMKSFLANQHTMSQEFVESIRYEINNEKAGVNTIVCGIDKSGPQLFWIDDHGRAFCNTGIGFVAIGDGQRHAESQFMFAKYTKLWSVGKALLLLHAAKKHAEVAPGVGQETDMFFIVEPTGASLLNEQLQRALGEEYEEMRKAQNRSLEKANSSIEKYLDQLSRTAATPAQQQDSALPQSAEQVLPKTAKRLRRKKATPDGAEPEKAD